MAKAELAEKDAELKRLAKEANLRLEQERQEHARELEELNRRREAEFSHAAR